jgi:hypothetical protein
METFLYEIIGLFSCFGQIYTQNIFEILESLLSVTCALYILNVTCYFIIIFILNTAQKLMNRLKKLNN